MAGRVAAMVAIRAVSFALGGRSLIARLLPAWGFLWLALPLPLGLDLRLIAKLQSLTSHGSSACLDELGVLHLLEGNVLVLPGRQLFVEEACSGVYSLIAVLACTLYLTLWYQRTPIRAAILILTAMGWVVLGNVARVTAVALLLTSWGIDASQGWRHDGLGMIVFAGILAPLPAPIAPAHWFPRSTAVLASGVPPGRDGEINVG